MKKLSIILILFLLVIFLIQAESVLAGPGIEGDICCDRVGNEGCAAGLECGCKPSSGCQINIDSATGERTLKEGSPGICKPKEATVICPPWTHRTITDLINELLKWILYLTILVTPVMIAIGAIVFMTSGGSPDRVRTARRIIIWTLIGFVIILFSRGIYSIITAILGGG